MQVLAHAGQVVQGGNAVLKQVGVRPNAREHQDLRRLQSTRAKQHFTRGFELFDLALVLKLHPHRALALQQNPCGVGTGEHMQVRARPVGR